MGYDEIFLYRQVDKNMEARCEIIPRFVAQNPKLRNYDAFFAAYGQCLLGVVLAKVFVFARTRKLFFPAVSGIFQ